MTYRFLSPAQADLAEAMQYSMTADEVLISAVFDLRRHPESWKKRTS
jgi:hypothetical protein